MEKGAPACVRVCARARALAYRWTEGCWQCVEAGEISGDQKEALEAVTGGFYLNWEAI